MISKTDINNILKNKQFCNNEAETKAFLIQPFLSKVFSIEFDNPKYVKYEFYPNCQYKKLERVDYTIYFNDLYFPVEAKNIDENLDTNKNINQIIDYITDIRSAKLKCNFGILTNGIIYKFFDFENYNKNFFYSVNIEKLLDIDLNVWNI